MEHVQFGKTVVQYRQVWDCGLNTITVFELGDMLLHLASTPEVRLAYADTVEDADARKLATDLAIYMPNGIIIFRPRHIILKNSGKSMPIFEYIFPAMDAFLTPYGFTHMVEVSDLPRP